jgi:hypothetical protein
MKDPTRSYFQTAKFEGKSKILLFGIVLLTHDTAEFKLDMICSLETIIVCKFPYLISSSKASTLTIYL